MWRIHTSSQVLQRLCIILTLTSIIKSLQIRDETLESRAYEEFKEYCNSGHPTPILEENCKQGMLKYEI